MAKKNRDSDSEDGSEDEESEQQFHVEVVEKAKKNVNDTWDYFVKWADYSSDDNSWEPERNMWGCTSLLKSFWRNIGQDKDDIPVGQVVRATPTWIAREKAKAARASAQASTRVLLDEVEEEEQSQDDDRNHKSARGKEKKRGPASNKKSKGKNRQASSPSVSSKKNKGKGVARVSNDSSNSDDTPLLGAPRPKGKKRRKPARDDISSAGSSGEQPPRKIKKVDLSARGTGSGPSVSSRVAESKKGKEKARESSVRTDRTSSDHGHSLFSDRGSSPDISLSAGNQLPASAAPRPTITKAPLTKQATEPNIQTQVPIAKQATLPNIHIPKQPIRRRVQEMPMPLTKLAGGIGNATKIRIAQGPVASASKPPQPAPSQKSVLSQLSFRKNSTSSAATASPISPNVQQAPKSILRKPTLPDVSDFVQSPVSANSERDHFPFAGLSPSESAMPPPPPSETRRTLQLPRRSTFSQQPSRPSPSAADEFLSTIMPPSLAAPMSEDVMEDIVEGVVTRPAASKQARASVGRIPKKWRWTGELFVDISREKSERVCAISLGDPTDPRPHGLQFKICLSSADSIRLAAFHETADLPLFLGACAPVQQFAKLAPEEDQDTDSFNQIAIHMKQRSFFTYAHLYLDETAVALLIVFSPGSEDVCKLLRVPPEVMDGITLAAALVPWELTAKEFWGLDWRVRSSSTEGILDTALEDTIRNAGRKLTDKRAYYQDLHILGFPKTLHDFMSTSKQTFCIWCSAVESTQKDPKDPGYETWLLRQILSVCNGRDVGYKADVRVIFVHVGALSTFHKLPALAERRLKRPDIRYMTYGTHESIPRNRWGIREIYPFGGVITFTPSAILQESFSIFKFIRKVEKHPLWDCYVLPSVVAMVAKLTCQGEHPLTLYDRGEFVFDELLQLIEEGSISLVQAPPLDSVRDDKPWIGEALKMSCLNARGILDECIKIAVQQYRDISEADLPLAIEQQIARDIGSMQLQPAIMDKYRRFVVIKGRADRHFKEDKDGYESADLSSFDFRDDFYKA